jgi:hypothetical protein
MPYYFLLSRKYEPALWQHPAVMGLSFFIRPSLGLEAVPKPQVLEQQPLKSAVS